MELSVIIPTYNNGGVLARTLDALLAQRCSPDLYEIVIVDDGSTDGTAEMVRRLHSPVPIRYVAQPNRGRAAARNLGARVARGRILLFLDSDFFAAPDLLAAHVKHYPPAARRIGIQGASRTHPDTLITPFMQGREVRLEVSPGPPGRISLFRISTRNLSLLRAEFIDVGGFDEAFGGYGWEDIELAWRLYARGVRFTYEPRALGDHYQVQDLEGLREKMRQGGKAAVYFWWKHGRSWWLGLRLEVAPVLLPIKWLVYRTRLLTPLVRWLLPRAEARGWRSLVSECTNHLVWEAYYEGVFSVLAEGRSGRHAFRRHLGEGVEGARLATPHGGGLQEDQGPGPLGDRVEARRSPPEVR
ncbi:MAG TPA: glycosyltransferase [bacterium]|nr:glycosyltransferase [bacterium]